MIPRDLFRKGLSVPEHETKDLHYIGEALPAPSLITSTLSTVTPGYIGGSPIPAREDHVHALDLQDLIDAINEDPEAIDLSNYYTKAEADALHDAIIAGDLDLSDYYTKEEVDALLLILAGSIDDVATDLDTNYYTKTEIDALLLAMYSADFFTYEKDFSYGTVVAPTTLATLGRIDTFRAFRITEVELTLAVASSTDYVVKVWKQTGGSGGFSVVHTITITASSLYENDVLGSPLSFAANDQYLVTLEAEAAGDGEILVCQIRGFYDE